MFCLNIALGNIAWRLLFKDEKNALNALALFNVTDTVRVIDDFGQSLEAKVSSIHATLLEDLDKTKMAHVELALHQQRMNVMATKLAQTDPQLRANATNGGAIIAPMGGGGRPF
jgi:hypothetical protein